MFQPNVVVHLEMKVNYYYFTPFYFNFLKRLQKSADILVTFIVILIDDLPMGDKTHIHTSRTVSLKFVSLDFS